MNTLTTPPQISTPPQELLHTKKKTSPPFWPKWPKGQCSWCVVMLSNFAERTSSWSCMAAILSDYSVWTSLSPSSLSRMIWNASGGISKEVDALVLLPLLPGVEIDAWPTTSASVSIRSPSPSSPSSSSPGRRTFILLKVYLLMAEGVDMGLMS